MKNGCAVYGGPFGQRVALGLNDRPVVGTQAPTRGAMDATVLIPNPTDSATFFGGAVPCVGPSRDGVISTGVEQSAG